MTWILRGGSSAVDALLSVCLERILVGTAGIHGDEHRACLRSRIWRGNMSGVKNKNQESTGSHCGLGPLWIVSRDRSQRALS